MELIKEINDGKEISNPEDVYKYLEEFINEDREYFIVLGLTIKNKVLYRDIVSIGTLDCSTLHPRETFKSACMKSASKIIIAHNHPSGDPNPSNEVFYDFKKAGEILGIEIIDGIIIGEDGVYSQKNEGIIKIEDIKKKQTTTL